MTKLFCRVSVVAAAVFLAFTDFAWSTPVYSEILSGNGETRTVIIRNFTAPQSGRHYLVLKNGTSGPRMIESCYTEDTVEERRQCLFDNLNERIDQSFTRMQDALIHVNGVRVRNPLVPNEKTITKTRGLVSIPVNLVAGANQIKVDFIGYSTARLEYSIEPAPTSAPAPQAYFLTNRIQGTTAQSFTLNARESFSPDGNPLTFSWLWGDEPAGTLPVVGSMTANHTYGAAGVYAASLLVTDTVTSQTSTFSFELVVKAVNPSTPPVNEKPKPVIQWALDGSNPLRVLFDGTQSTDDGSIATYTWRITNQAGVASTVTGPTFYFNFTNPGAYTVRLTTKDDLNLSAAVERVISVAPISTLVADEVLFSEKSYFGTVSTESISDETLNLPAPKLARLKIKNADGLEHPVQNCGLIPWPAKIECLYVNLVNKTYLSLYRVNSVNVFINGRKVTDATSINKQKATFETVVALNAVNTVQIRVRGWPTAFATVEFQALEENIAPVASFTFDPPLAGVPRTVEFNAIGSTDANDQIMSYRFQAKLHGTQNYTLDSDWQADPIGALTFTQAGSYDVLVSARDKFGAVGTKTDAVVILSNTAPVITGKFFRALNNVSPYQVRVEVRATDADPGDVLQYNFEFSNGESTGFQSLNRASTTFATAGSKLATVTVRDSSGATTQTTVPIVVGGNLIPIPVVVYSPSRGGHAPFTIDFDGSHSSDPDGPQSDLRFFWTFGDGTPQVEGMNVTHTFPPGTWLVTLTVIDAFSGTASFSRNVFSWVNEPPIPNFTYMRVPNSLTVDFDASTSTPGDSPIVSYRFEFGDGTARNQSSPVASRTYANAGIYTAAVSATDQEGDTNVQIQSVAVFNGQKPAANINLVSSDVILPASFVLNASGSASPNLNAEITGYRWTLPNGDVRTTPGITYTTTTHGNFDIRLEVRDSYGFWSDPVTRTYSAAMGVLPVAQIQVNKTSIALGQPIDLFGSNSYTLNAGANLSIYEWTMPNGTVLFGQNLRVTLQSTGLKTISLKVTDSKGYVSNVATVQVNVVQRQNPTAVIELTTNGSTMLPVPVAVSGLGSTTPNPGATITGYEWRVTAATTPDPTDFTFFGATGNYTITRPGLWTVALRVFDSAGGTSPWVSVNYGPTVNNIPVAVISPNGLISTAPGDIVLNGLSSSDPDGHAIINWHWLFSDGGQAWGPMPTHYFQNAGEYTATLRVQDEFYAWSDPVTIAITLIRNELPIGLFSVQNDPTNRYRKTFDASASFDMDGTITAYFWSAIRVGEAGSPVAIGTGQELTYTFPSVGTYTVTLDVYDNNGRKSVATQVDVTITDHPTLLKAHYEVDETNPMKFAFQASETTDADGIQSFKWIENGADLSNVANFEHTFSTEGIHNVTLEVRDAFGSLTTKTFAVTASESSVVGITLLAADLDPIEFFDSGSIEEQTPIPVSRIPASVRFQPVLKSSRGELDFSWSINGVDSGNSDALTTAIVEAGSTEIGLKVTDGENIVARVKRLAEVESTACSGDSGEICVSVRNGVRGPSLDVEDLVFEVPHGETISSVGRLVIRTIDTSEEFDFTEDAIVSGQTVAVSREVLKTKLYYKLGPFEAEMEVAGDTTTSFGVTPYFHLSGASLVAPIDLENASIKLFDAMNGRVLLEKTITSAEVIIAPSATVEIEIIENSNGAVWTSRGRADARVGRSLDLLRQRSSVLLGLGSVTFGTSQVQAQGMGSGSFSKMSSVVAQSTTPGNTQLEGVVAGTHSFLRNLTSTQDVFYAGQFSNPDATGPAAKYSMRSEYVPWQPENDSPDIIGADTDLNKTLECKAFESAWNATPALSSYISRLDGYLAVERQRIAIGQGFNKLNSILQAENAWLDANLRSPCGSLGFYNPDCMSTYPHEGYFGNTADEAARALLYAPKYYDVRRYQSANNDTADQLRLQGEAYLQEGINLGLASSTANRDFRWASLGLSNERDFKVTLRFLRNFKWNQKTYKFSSHGLKGLFQPPVVGPSVSQVPLNPFSIATTIPALVPIEIPKGTEAIRIDVEPMNKEKVSRTFRVYSNGQGGLFNVDGDIHSVTESFSAACRFANDGYSIRSVRNAPDLTTPLIQADALAMLRQIDFGFSSNILRLLRKDNIFPSFNLDRSVAYISKSLLSTSGYLPVDIDAADSGDNRNTLWSDVEFRPTSTQLDHVVRVEVDHPLGTPPERLEFGVFSTNSSQPPVVSSVGTLVASESTQRRSVYRVNMPVSQLVSAAQSIALSPLPNENRLTLEFRPVLSGSSSASVYVRQFTPKILFNARYKNFSNSGNDLRSYYGRRASSMVSARMTKTILALDEIGIISTQPGHQNDLFINDASLPFGQSFQPDHKGHDDGDKLDIRTFGQTSNSNYERIVKGEVVSASTLFPPESRFAAIGKLMRVTRAAEVVNRGLQLPLLREGQCVINTSNPAATDPCLGQTTLEECLFIVDAPVAETSCAQIHEKVYSANPAIELKEDVVAAHNKLRSWVLRNREGLLLFNSARVNQNLGMKLMHSGGESFVSREALLIHMDKSRNILGRSPAGTTAAKVGFVPKDWNMLPLLRGQIPNMGTPIVENSNDKTQTFVLIDLDGKPLPDVHNKLIHLFSFDSDVGHFDHYHLMPEE